MVVFVMAFPLVDRCSLLVATTLAQGVTQIVQRTPSTFTPLPPPEPEVHRGPRLDYQKKDYNTAGVSSVCRSSSCCRMCR